VLRRSLQGGNELLKINICEGKAPVHLFPLKACDDLSVDQPQAGADVTWGYKGLMQVNHVPNDKPFYQSKMCPVNVHWHVGAEHRSAGQYDENGTGPTTKSPSSARLGFRCNHYDAADPKFTTPYVFKHCDEMEVGETYEVHWPHSSLGDCGTVYQYQTPFVDGVFCNLPDPEAFVKAATPQDIADNVGVQGQVFTVVNDEAYFYPDLMRGMIVSKSMGVDLTIYTGSATGTSNGLGNNVCSTIAPITWQVDRKCHLISASSFDAMCADMKMQVSDMTSHTKPEGSRELVADEYAANNQVYFGEDTGLSDLVTSKEEQRKEE